MSPADWFPIKLSLSWDPSCDSGFVGGGVVLPTGPGQQRMCRLSLFRHIYPWVRQTHNWALCKGAAAGSPESDHCLWALKPKRAEWKDPPPSTCFSCMIPWPALGQYPPRVLLIPQGTAITQCNRARFTTGIFNEKPDPPHMSSLSLVETHRSNQLVKLAVEIGIVGLRPIYGPHLLMKIYNNKYLKFSLKWALCHHLEAEELIYFVYFNPFNSNNDTTALH